MKEGRISISITVAQEGYYANAELNHLNFVCSTVQPTMDMAIASIMPNVREYGSLIRLDVLGRDDSLGHLDPLTQDELERAEQVQDMLDCFNPHAGGNLFS